MTATININPGGELEAMAQSILADMGLDVPTAINIFLTQVVETKAFPFALPPETNNGETATKKIPFSELRDYFKGKIWMADDFDAIQDDDAGWEPDPTKPPLWGRMKGKIWMADDFDAPMEEFEEYM